MHNHVILLSDIIILWQNVVVAAQPTAMPAVTVVDPRLKPRPTVMIVTIVLTAVCLVQQCWPALVCLAPALIAAVVVSISYILTINFKVGKFCMVGRMPNYQQWAST